VERAARKGDLEAARTLAQEMRLEALRLPPAFADAGLGPTS
jgi:hypothetical protein